MPEASIDEDQNPRTRENDVGNDSLHAAMQPESQTCGMQCGTERALGRRILASNPAHEFRPRHRHPVHVVSPSCHERAVLLSGCLCRVRDSCMCRMMALPSASASFGGTAFPISLLTADRLSF